MTVPQIIQDIASWWTLLMWGIGVAAARPALGGMETSTRVVRLADDLSRTARVPPKP